MNLKLVFEYSFLSHLEFVNDITKGTFTLKSNSNKIMLCWCGGQHYLVLNKIYTL